MATFDGKIVLVTGGGSGIGLASALAFARLGAWVVVAGRREDVGRKAVQQIASAGGRGEFWQTDVTDAGALARLHEHILATHGRLNIAFNNAGLQEPRALIVEQDTAFYAKVFDTNVRALYLSLQHQIAIMQQQGGGAIVVNASVSGLRNPNPGLALYSASKAAVVSLVRSAAVEYAEHAIRINAVAPGRVVTDMMLGSKIMDMQAVAAGLPIRRMGKPEEVAQAVVWLASDASSFVVGHVLCGDGGFMAL
jgi:NAD(P)-dependent dehydrogenase (short-subunit alcohol dehydrogenase family)